MGNGFSAAAPAVRRVRAYFAPVNRATQAPVVFDPSQGGSFNLDVPPAPWISLGCIDGFARKATSKTGAVTAGGPAAALTQVRETVGAEVKLQFLSWTKLTMALATGSQHMNVLCAGTGAGLAALGGQATAAVAVQSGSTASVIALASADAAKFSAGEMVAVDADYAGQTGFVGAPVAGAYLRQPVSDVDYLRRITFNVGLVTQANSAGITLAAPLPGGAPGPSAKVQAVSGFVDREGGSFYQEWSGLFVMEGGLGERIFFHYPRLQSMAGASESALPLAAKGNGKHARMALNAQFMGMPVTDPLDGERVICYRSFVPAKNALV